MSQCRLIKAGNLKGLLLVGVALAPFAVADASELAASLESLDNPPSIQADRDRFAPADYGFGPGVPARSDTSLWQRVMNSVSGAAQEAPSDQSAPSAVPVGAASAATQGAIGAAVTWPVIPIHMVMLPDGRVMTYGTSQNAAQGAGFVYDVWNPAKGTGASSHMVLPNGTRTDFFCGAQSLALSGNVLLSGGDLTVNGVRNFSNMKSTVFYPASNAIVAAGTMNFPRWYASLVPQPNGNKLVLAGRKSPTTYAYIPELYVSGVGYRTLGINTSSSTWYYPKAFVAPNGVTNIVNPSGTIATITTAENGTYSVSRPLLYPAPYNQPVINYAAGKFVAVRQNGITDLLDLNTSPPTVTQLSQSSLMQNRQWSSAAVLPDGKVFLSGGSEIDTAAESALVGVNYTTAIWNPLTRAWTTGPTAKKPRLYHSSTLLLRDGTVLTGGGGAPGPVNNLNAEIYYPAYLYTGSGTPAARPTLVSLQATASAGQRISAFVGNDDSIGRVTLIRTGASTHVENLEERFFDLPFTQAGTKITATLPTNVNNLLAGYYMMFVFNKSGVPGVAQTMKINPPG